MNVMNFIVKICGSVRMTIHCTVWGISSQIIGNILIFYALYLDEWFLTFVNRGLLSSKMGSAFMNEKKFDPNYFTRNEGLKYTCFPLAEKPAKPNSMFHNANDVLCTKDSVLVLYNDMSVSAKIWFNSKEAAFVIAAISCYMSTIFLLHMLFAICRQKPMHYLRNAIMNIVHAVLCLIGKLVQNNGRYYEKHHTLDESLQKFWTWPYHLRENTLFCDGKSYFVALFGWILIIVSALLFLGAAWLLHKELGEFDKKFRAKMTPKNKFLSRKKLDRMTTKRPGTPPQSVDIQKNGLNRRRNRTEAVSFEMTEIVSANMQNGMANAEKDNDNTEQAGALKAKKKKTNVQKKKED